MKKKIKIISLILSSFLYGNSFSQSSCATIPSSGNNSNYKTYPSSCSNVVNYIPTSNSDTLTFKINYHFFRHPNGNLSGNENVTLQDCYNSVWGLNHALSTLGEPTLPTNPAQPVIQDCRIRFKFTNMYIHDDDLAFNSPSVCTPYFYNSYAVNPKTEVNVFFLDSTISGGSGCGPAYNYVNMGFFKRDWQNTANWPWGPTGLLLHELGHAVGNLYHTNSGPQSPDFVLESGYPWGWVDCIQGQSSNNIMGYNKCRNYLSPQQIGNFYMGASYQHAGIHGIVNTTALTTLCDWTASKTVEISANQTWSTAKAINGDLIIKAGKKLTIQCVVALPPGGRVIVEPTAKLVLDGGTLTTNCTSMWNGIQVWGDNTKNQGINSSTGMPIYQGMLSIINGGTIENAEYGVSTIKMDADGSNIDWSKTGGIIQAVGASFINNNKDVAFWPYSSYNSISYFKSCTFQLGNRNWSGWSDSRVSLYGIKAVQFLGNTFVNTSSYLGEGIKSIDSQYIVADYGSLRSNFSGFSYGIYALNSTSLQAISITHAVFTNNQIGCIYLSYANYSTVQTCDFTLNSSSSVTYPDYGLYLDNCTGYNFLNNNFIGISNGYQHEGAYINNSGSLSNAAYNNTFTNLNYGLWAALQNRKSDGTTGLIMNCNDFNNCTYNIGVQGTSGTHGVADIQGVHNVPTSYVRNTYNSPSCSNGNKYYVYSANASIKHASFIGSTYQPIPQPTCGSSVLNIYQDAGTYDKLTYCPANPNPPCGSSCRLAQIQQKIKQKTNELSSTKDSATQKVISDELIYNKNMYGISFNEKIRNFLNDSNLINPIDSVIFLLQQDNSVESHKQLVSAYIVKKDYNHASSHIDSILRKSHEYNDFCNFNRMLINLRQNPEFYGNQINNNGLKTLLINYANNFRSELSAPARSILLQNFGIRISETILLPVDINTSARSTGIGNEIQISSPVIVKLFPNPATNTINIELSAQEGGRFSLHLSDVTGRAVKSVTLESLSNFISIDANEIPNGLYFLSLIRNDNLVEIKKIIVLK